MFKKNCQFYLLSSIGALILFGGTNASAATISLSGNGPHYWEVQETVTDHWGWTYHETPDGMAFEEVIDGQIMTYDIFNNTNYTITGFAVGVNSGAGDSADDETSHAGWSGWVTNRWEQSAINSYFAAGSYLADYDYAYYSYTYPGFGEPDNPDYAPAGEPLDAFTGITGEFSFTFDLGETASPVVLFATDASGQELVLSGESSHYAGQNRQYTADAPIPEPATMLLFGTGIIGLAGSRLRKKQ